MCIATTLVSLLTLADGSGFAAPRAELVLIAPAPIRRLQEPQQEPQKDHRHPVPSVAVVERIRAELAAASPRGLADLSAFDCIGSAMEAIHDIKDSEERSARRYVLYCIALERAEGSDFMLWDQVIGEFESYRLDVGALALMSTLRMCEANINPFDSRERAEQFSSVGHRALKSDLAMAERCLREAVRYAEKGSFLGPAPHVDQLREAIRAAQAESKASPRAPVPESDERAAVATTIQAAHSKARLALSPHDRDGRRSLYLGLFEAGWTAADPAVRYESLRFAFGAGESYGDVDMISRCLEELAAQFESVDLDQERFEAATKLKTEYSCEEDHARLFFLAAQGLSKSEPKQARVALARAKAMAQEATPSPSCDELQSNCIALEAKLGAK